MNVAFDPWIPVVTATGDSTLASLCSVLTEGEKYVDLAVRPHERVSLMRLFLCVDHAALNGPKDYDEWEQVPSKLPDAARTYLEEWKDSFELFHPTKPWLQIAELSPAKEHDEQAFTPLAKLDFAMASGNCSTLFDHDGMNNKNRQFDSEQMALGLLAFQNFSTCGLLSRPLWRGVATPNSAKDAPCIASSMYHMFLMGKDLKASICINICDFEELGRIYSGDYWLGQPIWENPPKSPVDDGSATTFLGRLVPVSRAIRLIKGRSLMLYGEALRYPVFPDFPREFNASVVVSSSKNKQERKLVGARLNVRPWRQLDGILQYNLSTQTIDHALNLDHLEGQSIDLWVGTLIRNPGKQDILDSVESRFHIPQKLRTDIGCESYAAEVQKAQGAERLLDSAIYLYRTALDPAEGKGLGATAISHYWTTIEKNLSLLMAHIDAIGTEQAMPTREAWRKMLYRTALDSYQIACGRETPRQIKAFAKGWEKLTARNDDATTPESKEEDA